MVKPPKWAHSQQPIKNNPSDETNTSQQANQIKFDNKTIYTDEELSSIITPNYGSPKLEIKK